MGTRGESEQNGDGRRGRGSTSDDAEEDEEERPEVIRRTMRSTIVRMGPAEDKERSEDSGSSRPRSPEIRRGGGGGGGERMRRMEEDRRKEVGNNSINSADVLGASSQRNNASVRVSSDGERANYERARRDRDYRDRDYKDGGRASRDGDKDRAGGGGGGRVRDSDRGGVVQRDHHGHSSRERHRGSRDEGFRRDMEEEDRGRDGASPRRVSGGDLKGKEKRSSSDSSWRGSPVRRERSRRRDEGGRSRIHDRGHENSRRGRDDSPPSSENSRDLERPRFESAVNNRSRGSRNEEGLEDRRGRDGRDGRDGGGGGGVERRNGIDRGRERGDEAVPELHSIHKAKVQSVRPFGVFVRLDGFRNHGLVHLSQVSDHEVTKRSDSDAEKVEALASVVGEGEEVWVKVISVRTEEDGSVKVGCSIKYVSQRDGRDLDPNHLQLEKLQSKPAWQAPKKLELEAVYNVTCTRCGGHGHLRKECYSTGDKAYELLKDEDDKFNAAADAGGSNGASGMAIKSLTTQAAGQSSKPPPPSGPAGRGRAMVQPAWMKHGVGVGGDQPERIVGQGASAGTAERQKDLPEKVTSVKEALAILASVKEEKRRKKDDRRHRRHGKREKKHGTKDDRKEKHRKRHRSEDNDHYRNRKRHRA